MSLAALGLEGDDTYRRADMLGSAKRVAKDGQVYYDWEMVASPPPKDCPSAVGCLCTDPTSPHVRHRARRRSVRLSVDAFPENWRQAGNSLRRLRGSFEVRPEDIKNEADGVAPRGGRRARERERAGATRNTVRTRRVVTKKNKNKQNAARARRVLRHDARRASVGPEKRETRL